MTMGRLAFRFRRVSVASLLIAGIPAAFLAASLLVVAATNLSPAQTRDRDFGRFDAFAGYGTIQICPGNYGPTGGVLRAARAAGVQEAAVNITAPDFYVSGLDAPKARFNEAAWDTHPFPARYQVLNGRWPAKAGEVAVSGDDKARVGDALRVYASDPLEVVGVVDDLYSRQPVVLAGPGTWGNLSSTLADRYVSMRGQPVFTWRGGDNEKVQAAMSRSIERAKPGEACASVDPASFDESFGAAPHKESARALPWAEKLPLAYSTPLALLPSLTALLALVASDKRRRRLEKVGDALGLPRTMLSVPHFASTLVWAVVAVIIGFFAGLIVMRVAQPLAASAAGRPVDLNVDFWPTLLQYVAVFAGSGTVGALAFLRRSEVRDRTVSVPGETPARSRRFRLPIAEARRLAALASVCWAVAKATSVTQPGELLTATTAAMIAVLFLLPDLLDAVLRPRRQRAWDRTIAYERLRANRGSAIASVCAVAITTGITFGYLVLLQSWLQSAEGDRPPAVASGEVLITDRASNLFDPPDAAVQKVRSTLPVHARNVELEWSLDVTENGDLIDSLSLDDDIKPFFVASDVWAAQLIVGHELTQAEQAMLSDGGALVWQGSSAAGKPGDDTIVRVGSSGSVSYRGPKSATARTTQVPAAEWRYSAGGVMLRAAFAGDAIPTESGAILYAGVSAADVKDIRRVVEQAGVDPDTVLTFRASSRVVPALVLPGLAVALAALNFLLCAAATWSTARESRSLTSALIAIGVPPRRGRRIILWQCLVLNAVALGVGFALAAIPVIGIPLLLPGYEVSVPWTDIATLGAAIAIGMIASTLLATTRLRAGAKTADM